MHDPPTTRTQRDDVQVDLGGGGGRGSSLWFCSSLWLRAAVKHRCPFAPKEMTCRWIRQGLAISLVPFIWFRSSLWAQVYPTGEIHLDLPDHGDRFILHCGTKEMACR